MSLISIIHPSRGRPEKSVETFKKWMANSHGKVEFILSIDEDEPTDHPYIKNSQYITLYNAAMFTHDLPYRLVVSKNKSAVEAINNAAKVATGDLFMVVSDDTECFLGWDEALLKEVEGKTDWILKTQDGIQPWIITMPVMDRAYFNRTGYIYHPSFEHMFCDTWMSVMADVTERIITSKLLFPHLNDSIKDEVRKKTDSTWAQGEKTFINLCKSLSKEDLRKITDQSMINWLRNKGVR